MIDSILRNSIIHARRGNLDNYINKHETPRLRYVKIPLIGIHSESIIRNTLVTIITMDC